MHHQFWIEGQGWTAAELLKAGDIVRLESGENVAIDNVKVSPLDEYIKVYNFEVEDFHTYYVSDDDVLVHNVCKFDRTTPILEDGTLKKGWKHIDARHVSGNHPNGAGDLFASGTTRSQLEKAADKIVKKGARISDASNAVQVFQKKMVINKQKDLVRVVVDTSSGSNNIITIFPVRRGI